MAPVSATPAPRRGAGPAAARPVSAWTLPGVSPGPPAGRWPWAGPRPAAVRSPWVWVPRPARRRPDAGTGGTGSGSGRDRRGLAESVGYLRERVVAAFPVRAGHRRP